MMSSSTSISANSHRFKSIHHYPLNQTHFSSKPTNLIFKKLSSWPLSVAVKEDKTEQKGREDEKRPRFKWVEIGPDRITESQKRDISSLPRKMTNRCKALMRQIICFFGDDFSLSELVGGWVRIMNPKRADWLIVLKELGRLEHPLWFEVAEHALLEESFEANVRDYTKIIHGYAKQNRLQDAEKTVSSLKKRGFLCDQVTLTSLVHMYSKAGNLKKAEETFEEMKLLGVPLDKRSYGSIIMAYIRAYKLEKAEFLLKEMDTLEIYAGREVYKALLRAYSMIGDCQGAQRVFNFVQFAGIVPDVKFCGLLINAFIVNGKYNEARIVLENLRKVGIEPNDKCVALVLKGFEKENQLNKALDFLRDLEKDGILVGKEGSEVLVGWFRKLGVVEEVDSVLREYDMDRVNDEARVQVTLPTYLDPSVLI